MSEVRVDLKSQTTNNEPAKITISHGLKTEVIITAEIRWAEDGEKKYPYIKLTKTYPQKTRPT